MVQVCTHPQWGPWSINRTTRLWTRKCVTCGQRQYYQG